MGRKIRYIIGIFFILMGMTIFQESVIAGILMLISGIACMPITYEKLKISDKRKLQVILPILLFFLAIAVAPTTETETVKNDDNKQNQVVAKMENNIDENSTNEINNKTLKNSVNIEKEDNTINNVEKEEKINKKESNSKATDKSKSSNASTKNKTSKSTDNKKKTNNSSKKTSSTSTTKKETTSSNKNGQTVYITKTGKKYHYLNNCGNGTYYKTTLSEAKKKGLTLCEKCGH